MDRIHRESDEWNVDVLLTLKQKYWNEKGDIAVWIRILGSIRDLSNKWKPMSTETMMRIAYKFMNRTTV